MKFIHFLIQGTPEWSAYRCTRIGASDVAAILGICPYRTPYQLWVEKTSDTQQEENGAMRRGKSLEPLARSAFEEYIGRKVYPKVVEHLDYPFLCASLDGITEDNALIVELKAPKRELHELAMQGRLAPHYFAQCQMQLACTGLQHCHYYSYDGDGGFCVIVKRDDAFIADMIEKCKQFYYNCMIAGEAPELTDRDYFDASNDPRWNQLETFYLHLSERIEALTSNRETIRNQMIERSEGRNVKGAFTKMTKVVSKGRVDYSLVKELDGVDLTPYRGKNIESYRITRSEK